MRSTIDPDDFQTIRWSYDEAEGVGRIVLDRQDSMNAMSHRMVREIQAGFEAFEDRDRAGDTVSTCAVVVEGAGDVFSAGADVDEFGEDTYPHADETWRRTFETVEEYDVPIVAKVDGYCLGGGLELALTFDFRIASRRSEFGFPEVDLGILPSAGGTQRLPRLVGPSRAKELCMTGAFIDAERAREDGLVNAVHPAGELDDAVADFVETLSDKPPLSLRAIKDTIRMAGNVGLADGLAYEHMAALPLYRSEDHAEALDAWAEDRDPTWQGR